MIKRILFVNPVSSIGGAEITLLELMIHLDSNQYQPILICRDESDLAKRCKGFGIPVVYNRFFPKPGWSPLYTLISMPFIAFHIALLIRKMRIVLVHSNSVRAGYFGGLGACISKVPSIVHVRDYQDSPFRTPSKARFIGLLSDRILVVSRAVEKALVGWAPNLAASIQVVYDGIETQETVESVIVNSLRQEWCKGENGPVLGVIGMISSLKGQEVVLKAFPKILSHFPNARLVLVGEARGTASQQYLADLHYFVESADLQKHVIFAGFRSDIPVVLKTIDILVHPAILPDALPHVLLEACMNETPVVASDVGGIGEIIKDGITGRLVRPNNPEALSDTLIQCLKNPIYMQALANNGKRFVAEQFPISRCVDKVQSIYCELLQ